MEIQPLAIAKAVGIAFVASIVLATAAGFGLGLFGWLLLDDSGESAILSVIVFVMGALPYALCGFLAGHFADLRPYLHAALSGVAYLLLMLLFLIVPDEDPFAWSDLLHYLLVIPLAIAGGWISQMQTGS